MQLDGAAPENITSPGQGAEVTRYNVARIRAQIPPLREIEHDGHC
jgi:hypothetical protein